MAHVCLMIARLGGGGAERVVLRLARGLCERGHRVDLALFGYENAYPDELDERVSIFVFARRPGRFEKMRRRAANLLRLRKKAYPAVELPARAEWRARRLPPGRLLLFLVRLAKDRCCRRAFRRVRRGDFRRARRAGSYIEERKPDIVFTNLPRSELAGFFASSMIRDCPPVVPVLHNIADRSEADLLRPAYLAAAHIVAVSEGVRQDHIAAYGLSPANITTICNPAATPAIARLAEEAPGHSWFGDGGPPVVLGVGRLEPQKDFATLVDAFQRVLVERPCRLLILGEGPLRGELEERVRALGLEDCTSLPGWAENPYAHMARAALFVLSSRFEGFGNVLVEALACGCPAVSTDCPAGPAEILEDPELLAPVGHPEALAAVMLRALALPADRVALRAKAARFSVERAVDGYGRLIAGVVAGQNVRSLGGTG